MKTKWLIYYLPTIIASEKTDEIDLLIIEILCIWPPYKKEIIEEEPNKIPLL